MGMTTQMTEPRARVARETRPGAPRPLKMLCAIALGTAIACCGCARLGAQVAERPEVSPDLYSPPTPEAEWVAPASERKHESGAAYAGPIETASARAPGTPTDLPSLIDLALRLNPSTRRSWEAARSAAAEYAIAQAPYYPRVGFETDAGYTRLLFQVSPGPAAIRQWSVLPMMDLTYTLLDFGRRKADSDLAREQLAAANFTFNRTIQTVVFSVQRSFYALAAAEAATGAAQENVELASTDLAAVSRRVDLGLATEPALLLARERNAQAEFELENARTLVNDARASLAVAVGVSAERPLEIESLNSQRVPKSLGSEVEQLISQAVKHRPDLAAEAAKYRASVAAEQRSHAEWYPTIQFGANYGEQLWSYNFQTTPRIDSASPAYSALVTLKWDIFTGFERLNDDRRTEANRAAEQQAVRELELTTIAEVWRSYYDFQADAKKYDYAVALLAAAQESYNDNLDTYKQGLSTIVELLTADSALANARFTMIQATADLLTSSAAVAYAIGAVQQVH